MPSALPDKLKYLFVTGHYVPSQLFWMRLRIWSSAEKSLETEFEVWPTFCQQQHEHWMQQKIDLTAQLTDNNDFNVFK